MIFPNGSTTEYVGAGLKWVLLRNRLLDAAESARMLKKPNWTAIALDLNYNSQSHFVSDFKKTIGKSPTQYIKMAAGDKSRQ
jgi:AraC-like DNA-binding protein